MSMELWVFSDKRLGSIVEWQAAIDAEGYALSLEKDASFENLNGFLPCHLGGEPTGFECYHDDAEKLIRNNSNLNFGHAWKYALGFRWVGSKVNELRAAWMAGTAYAQATDGAIFDDQESKFRNATEARDVVRDVERDMPEIDRKALVDQILRDLSE
jgi:hypothetical protein